MEARELRDWSEMKTMSARLLKERTGEDLETWNERIRLQSFDGEATLRAWLSDYGVTGYAQSLLVMERFGYPAFMTESAEGLIAAQYADRLVLRPIFDALVTESGKLGEVVVQARKTYVSLVGPRRTFARIQPSTRTRVDLALRLENQPPGGRLLPSRIHESMLLQISLKSVDEVDDEVRGWMRSAYEENS
jgi:hypothetical protein